MGKNWSRIGAFTVMIGALCLMIGYFWGSATAGGTFRLRGDTGSQTETLSAESADTSVSSAEPTPIEETVPATASVTTEAEAEEKININTATSEELQTLPGIGASRAEAIIAYRTDNGPFRTTEELMLVSGIGEKIYAQIQDQITV